MNSYSNFIIHQISIKYFNIKPYLINKKCMNNTSKEVVSLAISLTGRGIHSNIKALSTRNKKPVIRMKNKGSWVN
jgi:hypothetical protein